MREADVRDSKDFMRTLKANRTPAVVIAQNGFQIRGKIVDVCDDGIVMWANGCRQFVFSHAISTVYTRDGWVTGDSGEG